MTSEPAFNHVHVPEARSAQQRRRDKQLRDWFQRERPTLAEILAGIKVPPPSEDDHDV